ncbi:hypothetical protein NW754_003233 [Fusarium falciforme]|nr:hypothetical protein NW754_003233 [Fusarium falciforme]
MHSNAEGFMPYHTLPFPLHGGSTGKIHVRQLTNHPDLLHHVAAAPKAEDKDRIAPNGAWGRVSLRGWCYQERALSRRVFHITSDELLIEQGGGLCRVADGWKQNVAHGSGQVYLEQRDQSVYAAYVLV